MGTHASSTFGRRLRTILLLLSLLGSSLTAGAAHAQAPVAPAASATPPTEARPADTAPPPAPPQESKRDATATEVAPDVVSKKPQSETAKPELAPPDKPDHQVADATATTNSSPEPVVGTGYHPFDKHYVLAGLNAQIPNDGFILEFEASAVPSFFISNSLFWFGGFAAIGAHLAMAEEDGDPADDAIRFAGGLEAGWRFVAVDGGYVFDGFRGTAEHRLRLRAGLAIADETFTNSNAKYSRGCCHQSSATSCECDRTPAGMALFLYWAVEHAPRPGRDSSDHMIGLSLKAGFGL